MRMSSKIILALSIPLAVLLVTLFVHISGESQPELNERDATELLGRLAKAFLHEKARSGHAVVIGGGVMGTGIAALLANIGWRVSLLDCVPENAGSDAKSRNRLAQEGLDRALKLKPPPFALPEYSNRIRIGNT